MQTSKSLLAGIVLVGLLSMLGCYSTPKPPTLPPPPADYGWTNAARLPDGRLTSGIVLFLRAKPDALLMPKLQAAGAQRRSDLAWVIDPVDWNNRAHLAAVIAVNEAGGHSTPNTP